MNSRLDFSYSSGQVYSNSEDEDREEEKEKLQKILESKKKIKEDSLIKREEKLNNSLSQESLLPQSKRDPVKSNMTDRIFTINQTHSVGYTPLLKSQSIKKIDKSVNISKSLMEIEKSVQKVPKIILPAEKKVDRSKSEKSYVNFSNFLYFNKENISLSICERLNCFTSAERILEFKNFFIVSKKSIKQTKDFRCLNLTRLCKLHDDIDKSELMAEAEEFESKNYSFLSIYHLLYYIKNFTKTYTELNKKGILKTVLASTEQSVKFIQVNKKLIKAENESILAVNFQVFSIFFTLSFRDKANEMLMFNEISEKYAEILFNESLV